MINHEQKILHLERTFHECLGVADKKGKDYSGTEDAMSNFRDFGTLGIIVRLGDKYHRAKNLIKSGEQHVKDESIRDTLKDIINYAALALIMLDEEQPSKPGQ